MTDNLESIQGKIDRVLIDHSFTILDFEVTAFQKIRPEVFFRQYIREDGWLVFTS